MPGWSWLVIAVVVVAVIALVAVLAASAARRKRTERLEGHFGPEYERAVDEAGDQRAAEKELVARERRRRKIDIVALAPEARARYDEHWRTVQTGFVDNPSDTFFDPTTKSAYFYDGTTFWGGDSKQSIQARADYQHCNGLAGAMMYSLEALDPSATLFNDVVGSVNGATSGCSPWVHHFDVYV